MTYTITIAENSHYMDEDESYRYGEYATAELAVSAAKGIVDADLESSYRAGMSADELYRQYTTFGRDPYIVPADPGSAFSAWDYARERCQQICRRGEGPH